MYATRHSIRHNAPDCICFILRCAVQMHIYLLVYILRRNRMINHCKNIQMGSLSGYCREHWKDRGAADGITSWTHCFSVQSSAATLTQVRKHIMTWHNWSICRFISTSISKEQVEEKSKSHNKTYMRGKWNKITILRRSEEDKRQANRQRERARVPERQTELERQS